MIKWLMLRNKSSKKYSIFSKYFFKEYFLEDKNVHWISDLWSPVTSNYLLTLKIIIDQRSDILIY